MAKKSNGYILFYTIALTVICGSLLGIASEALKPLKEANIAFDTKKNILSATMDLAGKSPKEIEELYDKLVRNTYVLDKNGQPVDKLKADQVSIKDEYRKLKDEGDYKLPVYEIAAQDNPEQTAYYVVPMYGFGLWDDIWGYVALEKDLETIKGTVFLHKGETPGLGARIAEKEIQERFEGKKIINDDKYVAMQKGEGNNYADQPAKVDGMSGATITAQGLNKMLESYLKAYKGYFSELKNKSGEKMSLLTQ